MAAASLATESSLFVAFLPTRLKQMLAYMQDDIVALHLSAHLRSDELLSTHRRTHSSLVILH